MELWFVGLPVPERRPGMFYLEPLKISINNPDRDPHHFQYFHCEPDSPWPLELRDVPHIGYRVDDINKSIQEADQLIFGPVPVGKDKLAFVRHKGLLMQFYQLGK